MGRKGSSRMLITVNVFGSPGPIRLLVNKDDSVATVVRSILKEYARQCRLPVLGKDPNKFNLCCASIDPALSSSVAIGSTGCRSFSMCIIHVDGVDSGTSMRKRLQPAARFRSLLSQSLNLIGTAS